MIVDPRVLRFINDVNPQEEIECDHDFKRMKDPRKMRCRKCGRIFRYNAALMKKDS